MFLKNFFIILHTNKTHFLPKETIQAVNLVDSLPSRTVLHPLDKPEAGFLGPLWKLEIIYSLAFYSFPPLFLIIFTLTWMALYPFLHDQRQPVQEVLDGFISEAILVLLQRITEGISSHKSHVTNWVTIFYQAKPKKGRIWLF